MSEHKSRNTGMWDHHSTLGETNANVPDVKHIGNYKVYAKVRSQTMKGGDGSAENPLYEVPNVEWISYFYKDYGIHGVYWHSNFGVKNSSHGCVGINNSDAEWIYNWDSIGTPVIVRQ